MFYGYINNCTVFRLLGSLFLLGISLYWIYTAQNTKTSNHCIGSTLHKTPKLQTLFNHLPHTKTVFYFAIVHTSSCKPLNKHHLTIFSNKLLVIPSVINCITFPYQASSIASLDPYVQGPSPEDWFCRGIWVTCGHKGGTRVDLEGKLFLLKSLNNFYLYALILPIKIV